MVKQTRRSKHGGGEKNCVKTCNVKCTDVSSMEYGPSYIVRSPSIYSSKPSIYSPKVAKVDEDEDEDDKLNLFGGYYKRKSCIMRRGSKTCHKSKYSKRYNNDKCYKKKSSKRCVLTKRTKRTKRTKV